MALKGFLASGFQKLIGASRIKGANDQWLGEYNRQTITGTSFPLSVTPTFGSNLIDWEPTTGITYNGQQFLSVNPTSAVVLTIRNNSSTPGLTIDMTNISLATGGLRLNTRVLLFKNDSITFVYNTVTNYFEEVSRSVRAPESKVVTVTGATISQSDIGYANVIALSAAASVTVTSIDKGYNSYGQLLTFYGNIGTSPITLTQDLTSPYTLIMNGDYTITQYASIQFVVLNDTTLLEVSRNDVGGYV